MSCWYLKKHFDHSFPVLGLLHLLLYVLSSKLTPCLTTSSFPPFTAFPPCTPQPHWHSVPTFFPDCHILVDLYQFRSHSFAVPLLPVLQVSISVSVFPLLGTSFSHPFLALCIRIRHSVTLGQAAESQRGLKLPSPCSYHSSMQI